MENIHHIVSLFLNLDHTLQGVISEYGIWTYALLSSVIFLENGLVLFPFLPGDSLIFTAATFASDPQYNLNIWTLFFLLTAAAILGDVVNYAIGSYIGHRAYDLKWVNRKHLEKTHEFFEKHGGRTIFLARFVPIIRTFAPFVAGVAGMSYRHFFLYNVLGGVTCVSLFSFLGYNFGKMEIVQKHFEATILLIIFLSALPLFWEWWKAYRQRKIIVK